MSDDQEIFDGVPNQHDGKDAAIVAELVSHGKGSLWPYSTLSESQQILRHQVLRMDAYSKLQTQWLGRLEAMVARHWPELTDTLKLSSVTIQSLLATYGSAGRLKPIANRGSASEKHYQDVIANEIVFGIKRN